MDPAEASQPVIHAVYAKFIEWRLLDSQRKAAALQGDRAEISHGSLQHLDSLRKDLTGLFFELAAITDNLRDPAAFLDQLTSLAWSANESDGSFRDGNWQEIQEHVDAVAAKTKDGLAEIHERHRRERKGDGFGS